MGDLTRIDMDPRGVATLWLARAEKRNALNAEMMTELTQAAQDLGTDPTVRVVVLRGEGETFCAGGDLGWMRAQMEADRAMRMAEAGRIASMLSALNTMPKPLIGVAEGNAFGGGLGMLAICDVALAVDGAKFGLTEPRLGLIPATIGPYIVARLGPMAREVFYSARIFDGAEACRLGLLAKTITREGIEAAIEVETTPYLSVAPGAVASAKALALGLGLGVSPEAIAHSATALADQWETAEARDGITAFFEKRRPPWDIA